MAKLNMTKVHKSWKNLFMALAQQKGFREFVSLVNNDTPMCPNSDDVFNAFSELPVDDVRIVIVGQDPYPDLVHATGISFGIRPETRWEKLPLSLKEIVARVEELYPDDPSELYFDQTLKLWRQQGILMLNRYLTCSPGKPGSHAHLWKPYTEALVYHLSRKKPDLIWYLIGGKARELTKHIQSNRAIFEDNHPAAKRYGNPMKGKFKEISELLPDITWQLPF